MAALSSFGTGLHAKEPSAPSRAPTATPAREFPALDAACQPLADFIDGFAVTLGSDPPDGSADQPWSSRLLPEGASMLALEENDRFVFALSEASALLHGTGEPAAGQRKARLLRRVLVLKPSLVLIDDRLEQTPAGTPARGVFRCRAEPRVVGSTFRIARGEREMIGRALWPPQAKLASAGAQGGGIECLLEVEVSPRAASGDLRWLHLLELPSADGQLKVREGAVEGREGRLEVRLRTGKRTYRLTLPPPGTEPGHLAVEQVGARTLVAERPLAAGILPHGPEGARLIERWDRAYRDGRRPPWDSGVVAPELKRVLEKGIVRPCRAAVLGCGSGTNAIYLAEKGFDVTAIDVAPTALAIAEEKAAKAGVKVRWLLADVLRPPELKPFEFLFDRGCYHNVRYVDAESFIESVRRLSKPRSRFLVLSLDRDGPPGVREHHMRTDLGPLFEFEWIRDSGIEGRDGKSHRRSWSVMLRRKPDALGPHREDAGRK